jgi:hypothetical protein
MFAVAMAPLGGGPLARRERSFSNDETNPRQASSSWTA